MAKACAACSAQLSGRQRFRDESGNYYCPACVRKAEAATCEICGKNTGDGRSYFRTDGTFYCEACFQAATVKDKAESAESQAPQKDILSTEAASAPRPQDEAVSPKPAPAASETAAEPASEPAPGRPPAMKAPQFREIHAITDVPEPGLGWGVLAAGLVAGAVAGMFTGSLLALCGVAVAVIAVHWVLMHLTKTG